MIDWNDLQYFLAVARHRSTIAAGKSLGFSQLTVQRRLAELERAIGQPLVKLHRSGYRLTKFGEELLPHAERIEAGRALGHGCVRPCSSIAHLGALNVRSL